MQSKLRIKIGVTLFLVVLFSFFYFMRSTWSPNSRTRVALGLSMIEDGTININKYQHITVDKAVYKGNYYADKAPGYTFTALPAIWASYKIFRTVCSDWDWANSKNSIIKKACSNNELIYSELPSDRIPEGAKNKERKDGRLGTHAFDFIQLAGTYLASGLVSALTAFFLYFFALRIGASTPGAVFAALTYALATPIWAWSTAFIGHVLAGSCLFLAFTCLYYLNDLRRTSHIKEILLAFTAGALLSWAVVVEYMAAVASVIIAFYGLSKLITWDKSKIIRTIIPAAAGSVIFILPLLIYNYVAFDSPFSTGYSYVADVGIFTGMEQGFHGLSHPRFDWFYGLLFGGKKGLFWYSPILLFTPFAIYVYWRSPNSRPEVITLCAVVIYYILWNSSYYYWHGGSSTGPRHLIPMISFMCLPLALLWSGARPWLKYVLSGFFIVSFMINLIAASVRTGDAHANNILFDTMIPRLLDGKLFKVLILRLYIGMIEEPRPEMILSLVPLLVVLILVGLYIRKLIQKEKRITITEG